MTDTKENLPGQVTNTEKRPVSNSPSDFGAVETLLAIAKNSLDFPRLKALHDEAVAELEKLAEEAAVRAAEAKKVKEEKEAAEKAEADKKAADEKAAAEKEAADKEAAAAKPATAPTTHYPPQETYAQ